MKNIILLLLACSVLIGCYQFAGKEFTFDISLHSDSEPFAPVFKITRKDSRNLSGISRVSVRMRRNGKWVSIWECAGDPLKPGGILTEIKYGITPTGWKSIKDAEALQVDTVYLFQTIEGEYVSSLYFQVTEENGRFEAIAVQH